MAEPYLSRLNQIVADLDLPESRTKTLNVRHFFSGAALYADGKFFASLSPSGLAVKLPADTRKNLIEDGSCTEFRFFANGPIKREYVALSESNMADAESIRELMVLGIDYVLDQG